MFCQQCGKEIPDQAAICIHCGVATPNASSLSGKSERNRLAFIILGFFLGTLGVHNFYAGYTGRGATQLLITLLLFWLIFPLGIVWLWNIIEIAVVTTDADGKKFS